MSARKSKNNGWKFASLFLFAGAMAVPALAEFTVRANVPAFVLPATDGAQVELARAEDVLLLKRAGTETKPAATVIHLLQPDCLQCQAQLKELQIVSDRYSSKGVAVLGIAHRGEMKDLQKLGKDLGLTIPLLHGTGSEIAKQFAAGDTLGIADRAGVVKFAQVGFGKGDEALWTAAIEELLAGKPVSKTTVDRERLAVGDRFPAVDLPSVETGKPLALVGKDGRLTFRDEEGKETQPKAAVGFFSRYWAFSREEMVHLQKFHERYAGKGLQVFVISMNPSADDAKKLNKELKVTYPVFNGHESTLGKHYAFGWPAFIIDAGGVIRYTQVGFEKGDEKKYEKVIKEIL